MAKNYVNGKDIYDEMCKSLENDELTPKVIEMCMLMNKEIHTKVLRYVNEQDRDDCMSGAMMDILLYWRNFKPYYNGAKSNAFAYVTQLLKCGSAKMWKKLHPEKTKNNINVDSIFTI